MNQENNEPTNIKPTSKKLMVLIWLGAFFLLVFYELFLLVFKLIKNASN
ncbi:MAG: hypothetical protein ACKO16_18430 [Gemmataceae bacterium]|jgi:hypothetical protein